MKRIASMVALLCSLLPAVGHAAPLALSRISDEPLSAVAYDILKEAYRRLNLQISEANLPSERSLAYSNSGVTDGEVMRVAGIEEQYPNLLRVKVALLRAQMQVYTTGLSFPVEGWHSLLPYRICIRSGIRINMLNTIGMQRELANSEQQILNMLRAGRCDVAVLSQNAWLVIDQLQKGPLRALQPPLTNDPLYHYVHRRHAALVPKLEAVLLEMQRDHSTERILQQFNAKVQEARKRQSLPDAP